MTIIEYSYYTHVMIGVLLNKFGFTTVLFRPIFISTKAKQKKFVWFCLFISCIAQKNYEQIEKKNIFLKSMGKKNRKKFFLKSMGKKKV